MAMAGLDAPDARTGGRVGLALIGPFEDRTTFMAVYAPDSTVCIAGRRFQEGDHMRRWLVIQGLDLVRRTLLGN